MEEEIDLVGKAFADHYNHVLDNDRPALSALYKPSSMLTFEGHKIQGVEDITAKLTSLPFDKCRHVISTVDSQPSTFTGGIVVFVSGSLQLAGDDPPLRYSQMFHFVSMLEGNFFVQNEIFRLNIE
ncbi:hypothetical protein GQ457_07G028540 [Hibiscus cannabinus]